MSVAIVTVAYNGRFPATCAGSLEIVVDGRYIYGKQYVCASTGSCGVEPDGEEVILGGELVWKDADKYPAFIQDAVKAVLSQYDVCCGGCI